MRNEIDLAADQAIMEIHEMAVQAATDLGCLTEYQEEYVRQRTGYYIWQDFNKSMIRASLAAAAFTRTWESHQKLVGHLL